MDNNKDYKKIDFKQLLKNKKTTIVSSEEALKDVTPIDWSDDVLSGKMKVVISGKSVKEVKDELKDFIKQNKEKVYKIAEQNTTRNSKGQVIISKDDPWFNEDEWEEHFKELDEATTKQTMKCHICGIQVKDTDGEICDDCLSNVNKRLFKENEKLNEVEYNIPYNKS